jgi:seryl-tRNA synthetase
MVDKDLQRERDGLLTEMTRLDARRIQLKAEIVRENRLKGVSKQQIALKQTERAELLHEREELRRKISAVNEKLKAQRIAHSRAVVPESVAQRFVAIARRSMPKEMFRDMMESARGE